MQLLTRLLAGAAVAGALVPFQVAHHRVSRRQMSGGGGGDEMAQVEAAVQSERASTSARASVARSSASKLDEAARLRREATAALVRAAELSRGALKAEAEATISRAAELREAMSAYEACEAAKRSRADTEKDLVASLESVVGMTPEPEIAAQLSCIAEAKADLIEADVSVADALAGAKAVLEGAGRDADADAAAFAAALGGIPGEGAPPDAVYAFDWSQVDAAVDRVAAVSGAAADADARAVELAKFLAEANALRDVAIGEATSAPKPATAAAADDAGVSARANELLPN